MSVGGGSGRSVAERRMAPNLVTGSGSCINLLVLKRDCGIALVMGGQMPLFHSACCSFLFVQCALLGSSVTTVQNLKESNALQSSYKGFLP